MGMFFPKGLQSAKQAGLQDKIFHFYAINAAAGCFAVVFALYLGIKIGYVYTVVLGLAFYLSAGLILLFLKKPENAPTI